MNLVTFMGIYDTPEACRAHMESVRWPDGPVCPKCGVVGQAGRVGPRPGMYRCHACKSQFSVTVGTAMEGTHLPLNIWYLAMYLMLSTAKPISAMSLSRQMQIQYRTCWHLLHRLRAMLASGETLPLSGIVKADETYVGGKARNRQEHRPEATRGRGTGKPMLFAAIQRGGEARTLVVPSASIAAIAPALWDWTRGAATQVTDELGAYRWPDAERQSGNNRRGHDAGERIARCLIGRHGRLRLRDLFA